MLFSIGLVFIAVTAIDYFVGGMQQNIQVPAWLQGRLPIEWIGIGRYRLFIIVVCAALTLALQWLLARTPLRQPVARGGRRCARGRGLGLDVNRIFLLTFAVGSGLAGLGARSVRRSSARSGLPAQVHDLFPHRRLGRRHDHDHRPLIAALVLGIADVMGKYYVPKLGTFIVYALMIVILMLRPQGLFARGPSR